MAMRQENILITGGGTGGHISPGIAIYEECINNKIDAHMLVGVRDLKFNYLKHIDEDDLLTYNAPTFTKNIFKIPFFLIKFFCAYRRARRIIRKNDIDHVLGMGGYVSAPALMAAKRMKKKIWLCEQNTVPGKVTSLFAKHAHKIFSTFEDTVNYLKPPVRDRFEVVGNPIRKAVLEAQEKEEAKRAFNLSHCDKIILAIGGSQGAIQINELVLDLRLKYPNEFENIGIIWCTGSLTYDKYKKIVLENKNIGSVYLSPFVENVGTAYRAADIAISRSGSGVMMELAAMELPSILIPYPYAAMDHQTKNADVFARSGAAVKLENSKANADEFAKIIFPILSSRTRLDQMIKACRKEAKPDAAADILKKILG
jgi:UDP-N-acetylglucosamine--N-acetylmuramyl-(pentapeptide) pyrophosphoryl-undecaprenol N-acetylglucosamine transferase